ncbi:MAG TPA: UDP-N-acetylenolpyruvoylglucosamine reductase [Acidimicrobiaceae bacterium]|nr:UDP-N-acetylenolpyruvoylglucosamine reductase [Acidimicrobiaceae bacterium]
MIIGKGSNLLVADQGFPGITVALGKEFESIEIDTGGGRINVGGNAALPVVARKTVAEELVGFEWAVGVPGSIGGAVRMNAGGHGGDMAASVESVRIFDLEKSAYEIRVLSELAFGYRQSRIQPSEIVLGATLKLAFGERSAGEELLTEIVQWRRENQPGGQNAGSVFVNPDGESAGSLIEKLGLKGLRVGSASVSDKHANFFQVDPGGSANDVDELMNQVADRVYAEAGVSLKTEIQRVGF